MRGGKRGRGGREDVRSWDDLVAFGLLKTGSTPSLRNFIFFSAAPGDKPILWGERVGLASIPYLSQTLRGILGFTSRQRDTNAGFCFQRTPVYYFLCSPALNGW